MVMDNITLINVLAGLTMGPAIPESYLTDSDARWVVVKNYAHAERIARKLKVAGHG